MGAPGVVWFRDDLRITDNPALSAALSRGGPVVALFVLDEVSAGVRPLGGAARWWLHHSLHSLREQLADLDVQLVLLRGAAGSIVPQAVDRAGAAAVFWNRRYGPAEREVDAALKARLRSEGRTVQSFAASLLHEPWTVTTGGGRPYRVFTPFWRACLRRPVPRAPLPVPPRASASATVRESADLADWALLPADPDWSTGLAETWEPGEPAALQRLETFLREHADVYDLTRDVPALDGTSMLSPRLRWGELSPHTVWRAALDAGGAGRFLTELGWREFAWHTAFHTPGLATRNLRPEFDRFPWPPLDEDALRAWQRGRTGVPLVDAGMRELWHTGHMHNRVRMVVASFLVKNLLIDWRLGEQWFWDTLVDADAASNPFNWQWVAGSGADAAPYFRVFNPQLQATKFDPGGEYVARWAPEAIAPIVDLATSRRAALDAYAQMRARTRGAPEAGA